MQETHGSFEWDRRKEWVNAKKHGVNFVTAAEAFEDPDIRIFFDSVHSRQEARWFCLGRVGNKILTVRFTYRENKIRIIGAGYWRKGERYYYEKDQKVAGEKEGGYGHADGNTY